MTVKNHEDTFFRKDGSPVIVECSSAPVEIDGKKIGAVLIARDIGERKRAQEELRAAHDELERRVEERTAELSKSNTLVATKRGTTSARPTGRAYGALEPRFDDRDEFDVA